MQELTFVRNKRIN